MGDPKRASNVENFPFWAPLRVEGISPGAADRKPPRQVTALGFRVQGVEFRGFRRLGPGDVKNL